MTPDPPWLDRFADTTRRTMLDHGFGPATCVLATRFGLEVLRYFGVAAVPEPVVVAAFTPDRFDALAHGLDLTEVGWSVGVAGTGVITRQPHGLHSWDGHLVIRTLDEPRLIDLSADQMHRPQHNLHLNKPIVTSPLDLDAWNAGTVIVVDASPTALVRYQRMHGDAWKQASDWSDRPSKLAREVIGAVIRELKSMPLSQAS